MKRVAITNLLIACVGTSFAQPSAQQSFFVCGGTLQPAADTHDHHASEIQPRMSLPAQHAFEPNKRTRACQPNERELEKLSLEAQSQQDTPTSSSITSKPSIAIKADSKGNK